MPCGIAPAVTVAADRPRDAAGTHAMTALPPTPNDPMPPLRQAFARMRTAFDADMAPGLAVRRDRLARVARMTRRHARDIIAAISADFGHRSPHETLIADLLAVDEAIKHARRHLAGWMRPQGIATALMYRPGYNRLLAQPLGVVGVVAPWNYPYQLSMLPAVAALAAGNRVMIKPSELTPRTAELMARIVGETFGEDELAVFPGDATVGKTFVELPFDHLFFTGSTAVGRIVAQAAAKNLTPVTLELGGKSPVIVDAEGAFESIAPKIAIGKLFNAGQTCIAPDYALVPRARVDEFVAAMTRAIGRLYPTLAGNADYTSIVNERHYARLAGLLADARTRGARVVEVNPAGEKLEPAARKLAPALILDTGDEMAVMREEIFGPLLPVVAYDSLDDAIGYVNRRDRPLALYWFGDQAARRDRVLRGTIAGGVTVNGCLTHFAQEAQPFGGVGASGIGSYHGVHGFRAFSKEKPVYYQGRLGIMPLLLPPYGGLLDRVLAWFAR
jgi:coniferyl-aldehyde dehydrogenase